MLVGATMRVGIGERQSVTRARAEMHLGKPPTIEYLWVRLSFVRVQRSLQSRFQWFLKGLEGLAV